MMRKIKASSNLIHVLAVYNIFSSVSISIVSALYVPQFDKIFKEVGGELPVVTQLILYSYRWLWLGAVFSGAVWFIHKRHLLSKHVSLGILACLALCITIYASIMPSAHQKPLFDVFDLMSK